MPGIVARMDKTRNAHVLISFSWKTPRKDITWESEVGSGGPDRTDSGHSPVACFCE